MTSIIRPTLVTLGLAAALSACSGTAAGPGVATLEEPGASGSATASTAPTDPQEAFLAYARCMRDNGIDMPDPEMVDGADGGGSTGMAFKLGPDSATMDKETFRAADAACQHTLANVVGDAGKGGVSPEDEEKLLQFARCMREHGVDMPDPQAGGVFIDEQHNGGPKIDPNDPDFQAAQEACSGFLPGKLEGGGPRAGTTSGVDGGAGGAVAPANPIK